MSFFWVLGVPGQPDRAFMGTFGDFAGTAPDAVNALDLVTGLSSAFATSEAGNLGRAAFVASGRVLIPDARTAMPRVRSFDVRGAGAPVEAQAFVADTAGGFPPREIAAY